jgi:hypothetical protein
MSTAGRPYSRRPRSRPWLTLLYVAVAVWWFVYGALGHELFSLILGAAYALLAGAFLLQQIGRRSTARWGRSAMGYPGAQPPPPPPRPAGRHPGR